MVVFLSPFLVLFPTTVVPAAIVWYHPVLGATPSNLRAFSVSLPYEADSVIILQPRKRSLQEVCVHMTHSQWVVRPEWEQLTPQPTACCCPSHRTSQRALIHSCPWKSYHRSQPSFNTHSSLAFTAAHRPSLLISLHHWQVPVSARILYCACGCYYMWMCFPARLSTSLEKGLDLIFLYSLQIALRGVYV